MTFQVPEYRLTGLTVTGSRGFRFTRQDLFIPMNAVSKIGTDAILVKMEDKNCPPPEKPNKRPPKQNNGCPPPNRQGYNCPPDRRSYDEYE